MEKKITDRQLMMFADGELNNKELAMDIVAKNLGRQSRRRRCTQTSRCLCQNS